MFLGLFFLFASISIVSSLGVAFLAGDFFGEAGAAAVSVFSFLAAFGLVAFFGAAAFFAAAGFFAGFLAAPTLAFPRTIFPLTWLISFSSTSDLSAGRISLFFFSSPLLTAFFTLMMDAPFVSPLRKLRHLSAVLSSSSSSSSLFFPFRGGLGVNILHRSELKLHSMPCAYTAECSLRALRKDISSSDVLDQLSYVRRLLASFPARAASSSSNANPFSGLLNVNTCDFFSGSMEFSSLCSSGSLAYDSIASKASFSAVFFLLTS